MALVGGFRMDNFHKDTKFLITGGAGFIGSNITEYLLNKGYKVRVLDNFSTGKLENLYGLLKNPNLELIIGDIRNLEDCQKATSDVDYVIHQAALGSVPRSIKDPKTSNEVNVSGTLNMMIASRDNKVKKFVYASSSSVYGDEPNLPKVEERVGKPLSPYSITKKVVELYARNFYELYGLPTVGLRYFNVFGRKQDPNSVYAAVIPNFVKKLLNKEAPIIHGDGTQSRDFTYIDNVIEANLKSCLAGNEADGEVFNIAYGGQVTVNELYETIKELMHSDIEPIYGPTRAGDIKHSNADITKAKKILNYNPQYSFYDGIKLTIDWYQENLK